MDRQTMAAAAACLICLIPAVIGALVGAWLQRRSDDYGWPAALLPGWARELLARIDKEE